MTNLPAQLPDLADFVAEYSARVNGGQIFRENRDGTVDVIAEYQGVDAEISTFEQARSNLEARCSIGTHYLGSIFTRAPTIDAKSVKRQMCQQAWWKVYDALRIDRIAPAGDRSKIDQMITGHCPEFTLENLFEQFGKYRDAKSNLLRGLAEQFVKLDPSFKSHDKMKVGVKGLPKRIIMTGCGEVYAYRNNGAERLMDVINAVRAYAGDPMMDRSEISTFMKSASNVDGLTDGFKLRRFQNGNAHLFIDPDTLIMVNKALAEYYGEVLPDCPEAQNGQKSNASTAVSKDLQFYPTPAPAADFLVAHAEPRQPYNKRNEPFKILEPSCGDGAILDALRRYENNFDGRVRIEAMGIEVHSERAATGKRKGHNVLCSNFLRVEPNPIYDMVLMNPPFYGKHYQQHVEHAMKFLRPGGELYAILPITAVTDHGYVKAKKYAWDKWRDLPVGSFSESGTNINTGIARFRKEGAA